MLRQIFLLLYNSLKVKKHKDLAHFLRYLVGSREWVYDGGVGSSNRGN